MMLIILQGILEALNYRISQGIQPERGFYVAFGHDEEVGPVLLTYPVNNFNQNLWKKNIISY